MSDATAKYRIGKSKSMTERLVVQMLGRWSIRDPRPTVDGVENALGRLPDIRELAFDARPLEKWDSSLLTFVRGIDRLCQDRGIRIVPDGLPDGARQLLTLAAAVPRKDDARSEVGKAGFLESVGGEFLEFLQSTGNLLAFVGSASVALVRVLAGRARFRAVDLWVFLQDAGAQALPIVSLISLLVGLILAFIGLIQLSLFGAQIYVADLVAIGMVRMMGAIMAGVIMAGRTGAAYAAQLGTMQVNEEIDALRTLGVNPMEFLVMPRMLALTLMMPLLCLYANLLGMVGGYVVAVGLYDVSGTVYVQRTIASLNWNHLGVGIFLSFVFGILVALSGCLRGMECGRSASAVGGAATSAVVTGIVAIVIATAVTTVVCNLLGI
jgi:phospholipid/cholesterol/gamma-HCH transport system permease protein